MNKKLEEQLMNVLYVTVGAASTIIEKAKEVGTTLGEKGKVTWDKCQVKNEELKHDIKEKVNKSINVEVVKEATTEEFIAKMDQLSEEEIAKIKEKLATLEKPTQEATDSEEK